VPERAKGIPNRAYYGDLGKLTPGELALFLRSQHDALRAGRHYDLRLGTPQLGLFSWATRKELPREPGETIAVYQQPVHSWRYRTFSGEIPEGYGAGYVHPAEQQEVLVLYADRDSLIFSIDTDRGIERYKLQRVRKSGKTPVWYLTNITPDLDPKVEKVHYKVLDEDQAKTLLRNLDNIVSVQPKIDGALGVVQIKDGKIEVFSHRISQRSGRNILHTERLFSYQPTVKLPKNLDDTILLGEIYAVKQEGQNERVLTPVELSAILNSKLPNAIEKAKQNGISFRVYLFDAPKLGREDSITQDWYNRPYELRRGFINEIIKYLPKTFHAPIEATDTQSAEQLFNSVKKKQYSLTQEGLVLFPQTGKPMKYKTFQETDVYIKDIIPGEGKYKDKGIGGLKYSLTPKDEPVGVVGTGLSDELRKEIYKNPKAFLNRYARIKFQEQFPESGAFRAPVFLGFHESK